MKQKYAVPHSGFSADASAAFSGISDKRVPVIRGKTTRKLSDKTCQRSRVRYRRLVVHAMTQEEKDMLDECIHHNKCERLVGRYWEIVRFTVLRGFLQLRQVHFTEDDIEELRNDVFVRLFEHDRKKLRQYDESFGLSLRNWIQLIASQTVGMYLRKKDRIGYLGTGHLIPVEDSDEALGSTDEMPRYDARQLLMLLKEMMKELSHTERLVLQLHFDQGLSWQEVASALNRNINNIYQIRHRALKRLKEILSRMQNFQ